MILKELKDYIEQQGRASRTQLAKQFAISPDGVDAMLAHWVKKGEIGRELRGSQESSCCQDADEVWYRPLASNELNITVLR
ncbi:FeoC-like transcriptional regulator [Vibrio sp. SS-MA-C1-2]|uniref:FeoC-like transcriptional regulator n=1 Tax=Vibrio sp. SS-MA-C1-2 TaxID=2908646 RepID=UPI001F2E0B1D|nr:FeoC-like transcriptional regulator [Vibrio sp. SS-MA-C1-2]UJF18641.1 FeoC-like transcriptional regulator [Vibrio sp. SS-MA-C1-2]